MIRTLTLALATALLVPCIVQAQDKIAIKIKRDTKGTQTHQVKSSTEVHVVKVFDSKKNVIEDKKNTTILNEVFDQIILEKPDPRKKPTALKRTYEKATVRIDGEEQNLPYLGKTILIESKNGQYKFRYDGGAEIEGAEAEYLEKEFNKDRNDDDAFPATFFLPKKAVSVGETWKIDVGQLVKKFAADGKLVADAAKSHGTGKLVNAELKVGNQFGDLNYKIALAVDSLNLSGKDTVLEPGAVLVLDITIAGCIDGSQLGNRSKTQVEFTGKAMLPVNGMEFQLDMTLRHNTESVVTELNPKK